LAVAQRIAAAAPVAQGDVEKTIRAEAQLAAIVIGEGLVHDQQDALAGGIGNVRIGG